MADTTSDSFIANVNKIAENIDIIKKSNNLFDVNMIPVLQEIANIDLQLVAEDFLKGNFLGNRKIDIDLSANKQGVAGASDPLAVWNTEASTVYYNKAKAIFVDGEVIDITFVNDDNQPINISSAGDLHHQLLNNSAFTTKIVNTSIINDIGGYIGSIIRISDIGGTTSNLERIQLFNVSGSSPIEVNPQYYWAKTTSSLQTLSMRASDIIEIGTNINNIVSLSQKINELIAIRDELSKIVEVHSELAKIVAVGTDIAKVKTVGTDIAKVVAVGTDIAKVVAIESKISELSAIYSNLATILDAKNQATIATQRANEIKSLSIGNVITGVSGSSANVSYNSADGKLNFAIPQGAKGDRGDAFTVNSTGTIASRNLFDNQPKNFSYLAVDVAVDGKVIPHIYFKNSDTSGDWSAGSPFGRGEQGIKGDTGVGIVGLEFIETTDQSGEPAQSGATDTWRFTYSNDTYSSFIVYNGKDSDIATNIQNFDTALGELVTEELL